MCKCKVPYSNILVVYGLCQLDISIKPRICIYILYCTVYSISLHTRDIAFTELWGFNSKIFPLQLKKLAWDPLFVKQGNKWVGRWFQTTPPWKPQNDGGNAGERRQVSVIFSPESATEMNHKIVFKARFSVAKQTAQSPHFKALQFKTLPEIWDSCKTDCAWLNNYVRSFLKNSLSKKYLSCCGCHRSNTVAGWNPAGSHRRPLCSWIHIAMHWSRSFPAIKLHLRLKGWENQRLPWVLMLRSQEKNMKNPNTVNPIILDMLHGGFRLQRFWRLGCRYQLPVGYHFTGICLDMHAFLCSSPPLWGSIPYAAPF